MLQPTALPFGARRQINDAGLLSTLRTSNFAFHLAGSFHFGVATTASDVDLYAEYSEELVSFLTALGFQQLGPTSRVNNDLPAEDAEYGFTEGYQYTYGVFEKNGSDYKIHVQVFFNVDLMLRARDVLAKVFNTEHTRTRGPNRDGMWHAAVDCAQRIRELDAGVLAEATADAFVLEV